MSYTKFCGIVAEVSTSYRQLLDGLLTDDLLYALRNSNEWNLKRPTQNEQMLYGLQQLLQKQILVY